MSTPASNLPDVFTAGEIARAAGLDPADVKTLFASGAIATIDGRFATRGEAVRAVRLLRRGAPVLPRDRRLFQALGCSEREPALPVVGSTALHVALVGIAVLLASLGSTPVETRITNEPARLVFLATPGPGGGGGGGGLRRPTPAPRAELKGTRKDRSPVPLQRAERVERKDPPPAVAPPEPAPEPVAAPQPDPPPAPAPPVVAPVASAAADPEERAGVPKSEARAPSNGQGTGGGTGTGEGTGMGEGSGPGIGPGTGGGTGGGPYRPGSGITPPGLLHEVKPDYTEDARRRGLEGDVVMEIVVRRDGTVGDVTLLQRLGSGLDQRAIDAVRQWRFSPARRFGTPVDVLVEVAVEFKLR